MYEKKKCKGTPLSFSAHHIFAPALSSLITDQRALNSNKEWYLAIQLSLRSQIWEKVKMTRKYEVTES